jgi:hypothetical protein
MAKAERFVLPTSGPGNDPPPGRRRGGARDPAPSKYLQCSAGVIPAHRVKLKTVNSQTALRTDWTGWCAGCL